jgi:hypothetical protein
MPAKLTSFTPDTWTIASDAEVPDGARVGAVDARVALGLVGGACEWALPPPYDLLDATTSQSVLIGHEAGVGDSNANGVPDAVEYYPDRLTMVFPGITQLARYYGTTVVAGAYTAVHILVYAPGQIPEATPNAYVEILIVDMWNPALAKPSAITDWCTPLRLDRTMFGVSADNEDTAADEGGRLLRASGAAATDVFMHELESLGDADDDGIENRLDTCPFDPNLGDPRTLGSGDSDQDGLDAACDPNDDPALGGTNFDEDLDGYINREDNCPLVNNGENLDNQADADADDIGDACDPEPDQFDGHQHEVTLTDAVVIGGLDTQGDVNCDGEVTAVDALFVLRDVAGMSSTAACLLLAGDANCDGNLTSVDALAALRYVAGLPVKQNEPCPNVGAPV